MVQEVEYYPYGMLFSDNNLDKNRYLYQGKELENEMGFGIYDFHVRGYDPNIVRTRQLDPKAESYYSWSPYSWAANNPVLYIDPDGQEVVIYYMGKERMAAFDQFMQTKSGQAYVSQFLKGGESVQIRMADGTIREYNFQGAGTGRYANSTLRFFGQANLPSNVIGRSHTFHKNADGSTGDHLFSTTRRVNQKDLAKLQQSGAFEIGIALNSNMNRTADQWAETLGHETFVHSVNNAETLQAVVSALQKGAGVDDLIDLIVTLQSQATSGKREDDLRDQGKDQDYNQYMKELEENKKKR